MRTRNAKKRHFQVETLEERLALDGTMTYSVTVIDTMSRPVISLVGPESDNSSVSYTVDDESSISVTVESASAVIPPLNPVSYGAPVAPPVTIGGP